MTKEEYYNALCERNPKLRGADLETVTLTKRGLRNIVLQAFIMGEKSQPEKRQDSTGPDLFDHLFRGARK